MKKVLMILLSFMFIATSASAIEKIQASIDYTADASVRTVAGNLYGLYIVTDGANDVTFAVYDNTAASGATLIPTTVIEVSEGTTHTISFYPPVAFYNGVYIDITTSGTVTYKAYYNSLH